MIAIASGRPWESKSVNSWGTAGALMNSFVRIGHDNQIGHRNLPHEDHEMPLVSRVASEQTVKTNLQAGNGG